MTDVRYSRADIANWARFSGDYNPIHFDVAASKRFGHESVIVHGMLAVLQSLERVQAQLPRDPAAEPWIAITQRLRVPIYPDEVLTFDAAAPAAARRFALRAAGVAKVSIDVKRSSACDDVAGLAPGQPVLELAPIALAPSEVERGVASLTGNFGWLQSAAAVLQATAFAHFMQLRVATLERWVQHALKLRDGAAYTVVQTSHRAMFDASWLDRRRLATDQAVQLRFVPTSLTTLNQGGACTCRIEICAAQHPPMFTEIGLFLSRNVMEHQ